MEGGGWVGVSGMLMIVSVIGIVDVDIVVLVDDVT